MAEEKPAEAQETTEAQGEETQEPQKTAEEKLAGKLEGKKEESAEKGEEKPPEKQEEKPDIVGDEWTPTLPEGTEIDETAMKEAREILKGEPSEKAQKYTDFYLKQMQTMHESQVKAWEDQVKGWEDEIKNDSEFKQGFDEKKGIAERGFREFFTDDERKYLAETGISSYLFRAMYKAGLKVAEPSKEPEGSSVKKGTGSSPYDRFEEMYKNSK